MTYRAFLSYSHRDAEAAIYWHARLQNFTIIKPFVGMPTPWGPVPHRLTPIFRDRNYFPPGHDLTQATHRTLDQSATLIVLCSPNSAVSDYVNDEILYFRRTHPERPIIPVLIGPNDAPVRAMLPCALAYELDEGGAITTTDMTLLAADPRPTGDGEVLATVKIIGSMLRLDEHWLRHFVDNAVDFDLASQDTAGRAEERHREVMAGINRDKGVPLAALRTILSGFGYHEALDDPDRAEAALTAKAAEFTELTERLNRLTNDEPAVQNLRRQAAVELAEGRFDDADATLANAEQRDLVAVEELEAALASRRTSAGATRAERAAAARLRLDYRGAASHYAEAAKFVAGSDAAQQWRYTINQASALSDHGREFGDNLALRDAISAYGIALSLTSRDSVPLDWGRTQSDLGNALAKLGERENSARLLEQAVSVYHIALEELTRERAPLDWAGTQNNLGTALALLGERESSIARLQQALSAFRATLKEWTRDRVPLRWAGTQSNLGSTLARLGERANSTTWIEEAIVAYNAALEVWTRERVPLDWALAQSNLGTTLAMLGEQENNTTRLHEALVAQRAALEVWTRERLPLSWAMIQNNIGLVLQLLGQLESGNLTNPLIFPGSP